MKKLNAVRQKDLQDCGVCVMQWIIQYYDGYVSLERLRNDTYTDKFGTTAYHIVNAFLKWNFDALGIYIKDINDKNLKFPLIAHLKLDNGLGVALGTTGAGAGFGAGAFGAGVCCC